MKFASIRPLMALCVALLVCSRVAAQQRADFFVAPDGNDRWSGTLPVANADASDGPFATLSRARDAVRRLKAANRNIVVLVREGIYTIARTVVFRLEDSGAGNATVTYAAYPGETPIFSSGVRITGWRKASDDPIHLPPKARDNVWVADVPRGNRFYTLYDAHGLLPRARSGGFIPLDGGTKDTLRFPKGTLKNWPNIGDVEIVVRPHHAWIVNILPLVSVDEAGGVARTSIPATYPITELQFLKGTKCCWVENVPEALDQPGEWVLNSQTGKLYLWPRDDLPPSGIVAPRLREFIRVEGGIDKQGTTDVPVRNLCFRGLTFMHGERYLLASGDAGIQHDWEMTDKDHALVRFRGAENCAIEGCHFIHSGGGAIRIDLYGQNNRICGNHIENIGGTGIFLCGYGPGTKDVNKKNLIHNNNIHHTGRVYAHSPGILIWQSGENRVANNLVHHTPYTAIILSGCMTHFLARGGGRELAGTIRWHEIGGKPRKFTLEKAKPFLHTRNNKIEYNEIHHAMEMLGDGNGIYIRGAGPENIIRRNYIHHLVASTQLQSAIRTDGGQRDTLIAENIIYKCSSQGIKLKLNNRAENNIIADIIHPRSYIALREGPMTGATIKRNILYAAGKCKIFIDQDKKGSRGRKPAMVKDIDMDQNIYYSAGNPADARKALKQMKREGVDRNSLAVDPLFVDPANGDFRLKPDSPAKKLGFVPIDVAKIGLRNK